MIENLMYVANTEVSLFRCSIICVFIIAEILLLFNCSGYVIQ